MTIEIYMNLWVAARELSAELQLDDRETLINPYSEALEWVKNLEQYLSSAHETSNWELMKIFEEALQWMRSSCLTPMASRNNGFYLSFTF